MRFLCLRISAGGVLSHRVNKESLLAAFLYLCFAITAYIVIVRYRYMFCDVIDFISYTLTSVTQPAASQVCDDVTKHVITSKSTGRRQL